MAMSEKTKEKFDLAVLQNSAVSNWEINSLPARVDC